MQGQSWRLHICLADSFDGHWFLCLPPSGTTPPDPQLTQWWKPHPPSVVFLDRATLRASHKYDGEIPTSTLPVSRKPLFSLQKKFRYSAQRGGKKEKNNSPSDRPSTGTSYPASCSYFKAEFHPATGGHQTRGLSHVRSTGSLPRQSLRDERGLVHHCWKFQFVPMRRKKSVCLRSQEWSQQLPESCGFVPITQFPWTLVKRHLERAFSLGTMPLPHSHHFWRPLFQRAC